MKDLKSSLLLYAVTDRYWLNGRKLKDDVEKAILGGATMIQLREKNLSTEDFIKEALEIKEVCKKYDIPFIINDSLEVFLAVDADGIHVGQNDLSADIVRKKIGPNKILGVSAETVSEALLAEKMGADYLGVGTIFSTSTKLDAINVTKEELARIAIRKLTPKEAFMLQGFSPDFAANAEVVGVSDGAMYKQAGNAMTVDVVQTVGDAIIKFEESE